MAEEWKRYSELLDRSCDALILGYLPQQPLATVHSRSFYIPGTSSVEEAFGHSLRKILGSQQNFTSTCDHVGWSQIRDLKKLEKRILTGTQEVICGDRDFQTVFEAYFSSLSSRFEDTWVYGKGTLYRYEEGKRTRALFEFESFWTQQEKVRWSEIHKFMRAYTRVEFEKKKE